jgi:hypothetical protein
MCFATAAAVSSLAGLAGAGLTAGGKIEGGQATANSANLRRAGGDEQCRHSAQ